MLFTVNPITLILLLFSVGQNAMRENNGRQKDDDTAAQPPLDGTTAEVEM